VVVIDRVVAMAMQGRHKVFLQSVRMAVIGDHFSVVPQRLGNLRYMGQAGQDGPAKQRQAQKCRQYPSPDCLPCPRQESLPETHAARVRCRLVISSPGG